MLRIMACTCTYAAGQLGDGIGPEEARDTALFVAQELGSMAAALRRLTRLGPAERRVLAVQLTGLGWSRKRIADYLGVCDTTVWNYLAGRRGMRREPIGYSRENTRQ